MWRLSTPKSRRSGALSIFHGDTSLSVCSIHHKPQEQAALHFLISRMLNYKPLHASDLEPYTSFQLLCIPASQAEYSRCDGLPHTGSHVAGLRFSGFQRDLTVAVSFGNAGSCNSQSCMLWLPIRVQVIHTAHIFNTSCTWHGNPGLQAGKLQATAPQPQAPRFFDSSFWFRRTIPGEAAKASISNSQACHASTFSLSCIPRTQCHLLLSPSELACEVTLKRTLTFQGTRDCLRSGTGIQSLTCFGCLETSKGQCSGKGGAWVQQRRIPT